MDFPPLDDSRWDRLLGAVVGQRPTVDDPDSPLATTFPAPAPAPAPRAPAEADQAQADDEDEDEDEASEHTIDLDAYA